MSTVVNRMSTKGCRNMNDTKLIRLIDSGKTQADAARELSVSRQAVSKRLNELRGRTTRVVVAQPTKKIVKTAF